MKRQLDATRHAPSERGPAAKQSVLVPMMDVRKLRTRMMAPVECAMYRGPGVAPSSFDTERRVTGIASFGPTLPEVEEVDFRL